MVGIIAALLIVIALYCAVSWGTSFYVMVDRHRNGTLHASVEESINLRMFQLGLCGIIAAGFAGLLLK